MANIIGIVVSLAFLAGVVLLQIYLSKRESKWFGLILPALSFLLSLLFVFNIASFGEYAIITEDGQSEVITRVGSTEGALGEGIKVFLVMNIGTVILLAVYAACREEVRKRKQLDKLNIQDLE